VDSDAANKMIDHLQTTMSDEAFIGQKFSSGDKTYQVEKADNFEYTDPVDGSVSKGQVSLKHETPKIIRRNNLLGCDYCYRRHK